MTGKTTNKSSPEVRARAVRMVLDHERDHPWRWATIMSISGKIGCTAQTLNERLKKAEVDSGRKPGLTTDMAAKVKTLERENREQRPVKPTARAQNLESDPQTQEAFEKTFAALAAKGAEPDH